MYTVLLRISARALIYFVHPLDPALIFFIRYFDPVLFFLFTTLTGTFIFATTENVSSLKKDNVMFQKALISMPLLRILV